MTPLKRAVVEHRQAHPDWDDIPDAALEDLFVVRSRALGLACNDLGRVLGEAWSKQLRRFTASR